MWGTNQVMLYLTANFFIGYSDMMSALLEKKKRRLSNIKIECHWYDSRCSQMQNLTPSRKKSVWCMVISLIVIYCIWMDPYQVRWTLFILCLKDYFGVNYTNCV